MRGRLLASGGILGAAAIFAFSGYWPWRRLDVRTPAAIAEAVVAPASAAPAHTETLDTLRRGETLSELLARHGVRRLDLARFMPVLDPRRLQAGLVFAFHRAPADSEPSGFLVRTGPARRVRFTRAATEWNAVAEPIVWADEVLRIEGGIDQSLYDALDAQVSDAQLAGPERVRLAWDLADIYAWQVDFTRDIQPGDRFQVLLERKVSEEGEVRFGQILAAVIQVGGKPLTAFRFEGTAGREAFYDADGSSLRRAFLRAPVQFRRISSSFARARFHPVLGRTRRHEGTDYAAASGTPVMAAGDGVVLRAGRAGGYGNLIELRHRNGITTRYGHLRAFARGVRVGRHVGQGDVIGYVGSTGLATGPHLHYEFRVSGVARDSRRVALGNGAPVPAGERAAFDAERTRLATLLYAGPGAELVQRTD